MKNFMPTKKNDLKETVNYVELYNLPKLNQGGKKTNNRQIPRKVIESVI